MNQAHSLVLVFMILIGQLLARAAGSHPGFDDRHVFVPREELTFDSPSNCAEVPGLSPTCGTYATAAGEPVCACPVTPASADPEVPSCDAIDSRAPLMGQVELANAAVPEHVVGSFPDLSALADQALASYPPEVWASAFGAQIVPLTAGLPTQDCSGDDQDGYFPVVPVLSPDSRVILLGQRWKPCEGSEENRLSLIRCDGGEADPGWSLREMLSGHSNWLVDWGHQTLGERTLYYPRDGYTRLAISADTLTVYDDAGDPVEALVVGYPETIVRIGAADNAVAFAERDGDWRDLYTAFLTADISVRPANDDRVCLFRWSVLVSDLTDCDASCLAGGGAAGERYCCRTALIDSACYADGGGEPTNPTLSLDGKLLALHRDRLVPAPELIASTVYLLHNPFERGLAGCVTEGRDGLDQEYDCTPEVMGNEPWDNPGSFCAPIASCAEARVDCSLCASIGSYEKGRNHLGFFEWPPSGGPRRQYFQFERACTAAEPGCEGNPGGGPGRLDIYEIALAGEELQSPSRATLDFLAEETGYSAWSTGFHRTYHCHSPGPNATAPIFCDRFESGGLAIWSAAAP